MCAAATLNLLRKFSVNCQFLHTVMSKFSHGLKIYLSRELTQNCHSHRFKNIHYSTAFRRVCYCVCVLQVVFYRKIKSRFSVFLMTHIFLFYCIVQWVCTSFSLFFFFPAGSIDSCVFIILSPKSENVFCRLFWNSLTQEGNSYILLISRCSLLPG